jgi:hypothetical protein
MRRILYTQQEAATMLGFQHYRSLNRLIAQGTLECVKRPGRNGQKLFTENQIQGYIKQCKSIRRDDLDKFMLREHERHEKIINS